MSHRNRNVIDRFGTWAQPLSDTEAEKCENAESMVRKAIDASLALKGRQVRVFTQGSYRNNTNVRAESDVDIAVCCKSLIHPDYSHAPNVNDQSAGLIDSDYNAAQLRIDVGAALRSYFGESGVSAGNKAFDIHSNSYRVDADVVPCIEHRLYSTASDWRTGTSIFPASGGVINNWPEQNYRNGVEKNTATSVNFKKLVRVLKNLRNYMADEGHTHAGPIPSYLIECLSWNVPNAGFMHTTYEEDVDYILTFLYENTLQSSDCHEWTEINDVKYLFRDGQPWTRTNVNNFLGSAIILLGME